MSDDYIQGATDMAVVADLNERMLRKSLPTENEWREFLNFVLLVADSDILDEDVIIDARELLRIWGEIDD